MNYSSFGTGVEEVDRQHENIDALTALYEGDVNEGNRVLWMAQLLQLVQMHFEFEEILLHDSIDESHKDAHAGFLSDLAQLTESHRNDNVSKEFFLSSFRSMLSDHVTKYDSGIRGDI